MKQINQRNGMLCGFGDKLDVINQTSKQSGEYYCAKCGEYVLNLQQAIPTSIFCVINAKKNNLMTKNKKIPTCPNCLLSKNRHCSPCYNKKYSKFYYLKQILQNPNYNQENYQKRKKNEEITK